jgi:hypothetical protein
MIRMLERWWTTSCGWWYTRTKRTTATIGCIISYRTGIYFISLPVTHLSDLSALLLLPLVNKVRDPNENARVGELYRTFIKGAAGSSTARALLHTQYHALAPPPGSATISW